MFRCALFRCTFAAAVVAAGLIAPAAAQQQRAFPPDTLRGAMVFGDDRQLSVNGRATHLSPGSRIRNQDNMIVLSATLAGTRQLVHYTLDAGEAQVRDVWILRPDEAAIKPWPSTLEQARSWSFDTTTMRWSKP